MTPFQTMAPLDVWAKLGCGSPAQGPIMLVYFALLDWIVAADGWLTTTP